MAIKAVYPGTFDPLTRGHEDLVRRAAALFGNLVVGIADSRLKRPFFSADERVQMAREVLSAYPGVTVLSFGGLLRDFVLSQKARVIVRGLRAVSDFEYEFQMALMNRHLAPGLETVFMMPAEQYTYISSRLIKEVFGLGGHIEGLVPPLVEQRLRARRQATPLPHARLT